MHFVGARTRRLHRWRALAVTVGLLLASTWAAVVLAPVRADEGASVAETADEGKRPAYTVTIEGVEDGGLSDLLERSSQLIALKDNAPASEAGLVRRITDDLERFRIVLRAEGYYDSTIEYRIDRTAIPANITVVIDTGRGYRLTHYDVTFSDGSSPDSSGPTTQPSAEPIPPPPPPPPLSNLGLKLDARVRSAEILMAEKRIFAALADAAYPFAKLIDRRVVVDHRDQSVSVDVAIDPGPFCRFGAVSFVGLIGVHEWYVRSLVPWKEGEPYDQRKVDAFRGTLAKSGLFSSVVVNPAKTIADNGTVPISVETIEGNQHSIGAGAKYYTSEGPAGEVFWEHRNMFGASEDLRITLEVGQIRQQATVDVIKPDVYRPEQDLLGEVKATRQKTDAFDELGASILAKIRRPLSEHWTGSAGGSLEWSQLNNDEDGTITSTLLGIPGTLERDTTDDPLDPRRGMRLRVDETPYTGWSDQAAHFLVSSVGASSYLPLSENKRYVLATRAKIGSIVGASRGDIPSNKRLYGGGGDSIRGYEFQKVGPLDDSEKPLGGRSLFEASAELRAMVWGNLGLVPFVDAGQIYTPVVPDFSENLQWAAGLGLRYLTVVGPVRVDFAFPLNPREHVDDLFQFYIGLGQAF
ncbi:MAG: outer membrane protein assembly factor [Rhodospirillales bacterium]|nr:outer membrane protein assembly factor [Rhodospirillales bacterium]